MWGDDPPFLTVGTEVSAKYKGAFCEAKVRKVVRSVKCKITFKLGLGTLNVTDDQIRGGTLRVGSVCEVKHPEKKEFVEAIINKIQDCSQYTVVFDDGDITTLRRTALCLKSGRHFAESETLDQLPLTHPEHFSNPVIGGRKGRRSRQAQEDSSDEDEVPKKGKKKNEKEADIGKVVCVELGDKKKQKDNWFPGLVVAPTAQDTVRIRVKDEYLVRSFKDGRYFTVPKKEATEFTREIGSKVDNHTLKAAVEKALQYLDRDELPPHWDRDLLFGLDESSGNSDSDGALDSDSSDDEPREEKDHFVAQLYKFMDDRGTPINRGPTIGTKDVDLYKLFKVVHKLGGYNRVTNHNQWKTISQKLGFGQGSSSTTNLVKQSYKKFLHSFEDFYRKLGCTMVNHPRGHRSRHRTGRSLIRDRDRATPTIIAKEKEKEKEKEKKEEKPVPKPEETVEKVISCEKEEESISEDKKECPKAKEPVKKYKGREEKTENQTKLKGKDQGNVSHSELEEKDSRSRSRKESKISTTKPIEDTVKEEKVPIPVAVIKQEPEVNDEAKSRETKLKTRDLKPKVKTIEKSKVKEEKPKPPEDEKVDEVKKKSEKKPELEEVEKIRSKSKEDARNRKEVIPVHDTRTMKEKINKPPIIRKEDESMPQFKKRGRKRKDLEEKPKAEEASGHLASHVTVCVGDKLKVYYGPTHESKVTYEAKVLEIEEDGSECMYLVHYTGWNTRYDEWIKRGRIADNLSWTPTRAKRQRQQQSQHKASRPSLGKRGRPSGTARGQDGLPNPPRSTTPSSVTSSSSQNKSPASRLTPRSSRGMGEGPEFRRRTRRMSGHTDISVASDSESEEFQSDIESEVAQTRSRTTEQRKSTPISSTSQPHADINLSGSDVSCKSDVVSATSTPTVVKDEPFPLTPSRKKSNVGNSSNASNNSNTANSKVSSQLESTGVEAEVKTEQGLKGKAYSDIFSNEKRRSRRGKASASSSLSPHNVKIISDSKTILDNESEEPREPKGRDFDLNQIRSELKGIEKAVKLTQEIIPPAFCSIDDESKETSKVTKSATSIDWDVSEKKDDLKVKPKKEIKEEEKPDRKVNLKDVQNSPSAEEDVYEFKDTEPLELEVRKRDTLSLSDSKSLQRRSTNSSRHLESFSVAHENILSSSSNLLPVSSSISVSNTSRIVNTKSPRKRLIHMSSKDIDLTNEGGKKMRGTSKKKVSSAEGKIANVMSDFSKSETVSSTLMKSGKTSTTGSEPSFEDICSPSLLPGAVTLSVPQKNSSGLTRLQTSTLDLESACNRPNSPPLLSLPDVDDDEGEDGNNVGDNAISAKSRPLAHLSIFSENHDDGDDDHEDRLVISESDDMVTEIAEPLFSHQQRDHEDLFPTLVSSAAVVTAAPTSSIMKTEEIPCLSSAEVAPTIFHDFGSTILESSQRTSLQHSTQRTTTRSSLHCVLSSPGSGQDGGDVIKDLLDHQHVDYGDDSINAAISRALDHSIMDEDDTSGDMEFFCSKQMSGMSSTPAVSSSISFQNTASGNKSIAKTRCEEAKQATCLTFGDSDSIVDSSDEEDQRLVIDPAEDDGNSQTPTRSSPFSSSPLRLSMDNLNEPEIHDSSCDTDSQVLGVENSRKISHETTIPPTVIVSCSSSAISESDRKSKMGTSLQNVNRSKNEVPDNVSIKEEILVSLEGNYKNQFEKEDKFIKQSGSNQGQSEAENTVKLSTNLSKISSGIIPVIVKMNVDNPEKTTDKPVSSDTKVLLKDGSLSKSANKGLSSLKSREVDLNRILSTTASVATTACTTASLAFNKNLLIATNTTKSIPISSAGSTSSVTSSQSTSVSLGLQVPSQVQTTPSNSSKVWKSLKNTSQEIITEVSRAISASSTSAPFSRSFGATYSGAKMSGNLQKASAASDKNFNDKNVSKIVTTTVGVTIGTSVAVNASSVLTTTPSVTSPITSANIVSSPIITPSVSRESLTITSVPSSDATGLNVTYSFTSLPPVSSTSSCNLKDVSNSGVAATPSVTSCSATSGSNVPVTSPVASIDTVGSITGPPIISTAPDVATVPSISFAPTIIITPGARTAPKRMALPTVVSPLSESSPGVTSSQVVVSSPTMSYVLPSSVSDETSTTVSSTLTSTVASTKIMQSIPALVVAPTDISPTTSIAMTALLQSVPRVSASLKSSVTKTVVTTQVTTCVSTSSTGNSVTSVLPLAPSVSSTTTRSASSVQSVGPSSLAASGPFANISPSVTVSPAVTTSHLAKNHLANAITPMTPLPFSIGSAQSANVRVATTVVPITCTSSVPSPATCAVSSVTTTVSSLVSISNPINTSIVSLTDSPATATPNSSSCHSVLSGSTLPILSLIATSCGSTSTPVASAVITASTTLPITSAVVSNIASGLGKSAICSVSSTPSSVNSPVTILLGSSSCLSATSSSDCNLMISSASTDDSATSDNNEKVIDGSITIVSNSVVSSVSSSSINTATSSATTISSAATIPSTAAVVSSSFSPCSSVSQQNSNLKLMCDAIKHSDSSVIALTSLSLGESEIISGDIRIDPRSDDADSQLLGSLLCQETIPGSPAQIVDGGYEEAVQESKVLVLEMPFASVPASTCDATNSSVPMSVPLTLPMVNVAALAEVKATEMQDGAQSSDVNMPLTIPPGPEITSPVSAACSAHHVLVIPSASASKLNPSEAAPVMENTPPTTPDSSLSTISGSPREDHRGMSPGMDNESSKSHRDSFEMDLDSCPEDSLLNVEVSNACNNRLKGLELLSKKEYELDKECDTSPKKRRRSRKRSESENLKRVRCTSTKTVRPNGGTGSDSDDTSENSTLDCTPLASSESTLSSKSPRPSKYNFYVELDPELDGSQRIALLQQKLQELRKTYMSVKAELACIDRRRKKLRRREREVEKTSKQEVTCS